MAVVSLQDMVKVYGGGEIAVRGIDLEIPDKAFAGGPKWDRV